MPFYQLFYHFVWSTKNRLPLITPKAEPLIYEFLRTKAVGLGGIVFALNGTADHIHLVGSVPPKISLATFIGQVKGVASTKFNQSEANHTRFAWQEEYGVFSFDGKRLPNYIAYVERQKEHHANNTTIPILERLTAGGVSLVREEPPLYHLEEDAWRQELEILDENGGRF